MPQDPKDAPPHIYALKQNLQKLYGRPGILTPTVQGALNNVENQYPDVKGMDVSEMPWENPLAGTNYAGTTGVEGENFNKIQINPGIGIAWPQRSVEEVIAHEAQHVRQNNADPTRYLKELSLPYDEKPMEQEGFDAMQRYINERYDGKRDLSQAAALGALIQYLPQSPYASRGGR